MTTRRTAVPADPAQLSVLTEFLREFGSAAALAPTQLGNLELALEEIFLNIAMHGSEPGVAPRVEVLLRDFRHGDHLFVHSRCVLLDGANRQQIRDTHHGLGNTADIGRHHWHAAQQRFENDARARFRPQRRHQQHPRACQQ